MNYSLLEELWDDYKVGSSNKPSVASKKEKKAKREQKMGGNIREAQLPSMRKQVTHLPQDPICQLYAKRNLSMDRPYAEDRCNREAKSYYASDNARMDPSTYQEVDSKDVQYNDVQINAADDAYNLSSTFADEDDLYLMNAIQGCSAPTVSDDPMNEYTEMYDQTTFSQPNMLNPDEYIASWYQQKIANDTNANPYVKLKDTTSPVALSLQETTYAEDVDVVFAEDMVREKNHHVMSEELIMLRKEIAMLRDMVHDMSQNMKNDPHEVQYFDFAIFMFGGVVLIFIMEQFLQIGIHMRKQPF